jgi:hypothetical protein
MTDMEHNAVVCSNCRNDVLESDEFCPHCGAMLVDGLWCDRHRSIAAAGVCIICALPYCHDCGGVVYGRFLCDRHSGYEIYEGMVRVYGVLDDVMANTRSPASSRQDSTRFSTVVVNRRGAPALSPRFTQPGGIMTATS